MFSESSLQKFALSLSLLGLVMLFAFSVLLEAREVSLYELDESFVGERVKLQARLIWFKVVNGVAIFELRDELGLESLRGALFSPAPCFLLPKNNGGS
jgi:hypothetical protein